MTPNTTPSVAEQADERAALSAPPAQVPAAPYEEITAAIHRACVNLAKSYPDDQAGFIRLARDCAIDVILALPPKDAEPPDDALRLALEVIAVGDSSDPVRDAGDELVALGYWRAEGLAQHRAALAASQAASHSAPEPVAVIGDKAVEEMRARKDAPSEPFGWFIELDATLNPKAGPVYLGGASKEIMEQARGEGDGQPFPLYAPQVPSERQGVAVDHWCALEHGGVFCDVCTRHQELVKSGWFSPVAAAPAAAVPESPAPSDEWLRAQIDAILSKPENEKALAAMGVKVVRLSAAQAPAATEAPSDFIWTREDPDCPGNRLYSHTPKDGMFWAVYKRATPAPAVGASVQPVQPVLASLSPAQVEEAWLRSGGSMDAIPRMPFLYGFAAEIARAAMASSTPSKGGRTS